MTDRLQYFDNNATTKVDPRVLEVMLPYLGDNFFNPSSTYSQAKITGDSIASARKTIQKYLGAGVPSEIIFTGSATEANNMSIKGVLAANPNRKHIVTTMVEHPSVYSQCKDLEKQGYEVTYLPVNEDGNLNTKDLMNALRDDTAIVSIMHANNETGVVFPIEKLAKIVKMTDDEIVFHCDATQSIGKREIDLKKNFKNVDLLSFSGHKIYAPKGIGVLYTRRGTRMRPYIVGGHQERGRRAGTENTAYIMGLAKAVELLAEGASHIQKQKELRDQLETYISENIKAIRINGQNADRLENTSSISFQGIEGESILYAMNEYGFCASTGSACSSGSLASSYVLQAMSIPFDFAHGTVRFSFGRYNTEEELNYLFETFPKIVERLREMSPFWDSKKQVAINLDKNWG